MEKIVISPAEVAETQSPADQPARLEPKLAPAVPRWAKWALAPLVLFLPLLCLVAIVLRVAMRGLPPRTRHEWTSLLATLLIISGILTSVAAVLAFSFAPLPPVAGTGLSELDEEAFPSLPAVAPMSARDVSEKLKPLVAVISPAQRSWLTHQEMPSRVSGPARCCRQTRRDICSSQRDTWSMVPLGTYRKQGRVHSSRWPRELGERPMWWRAIGVWICFALGAAGKGECDIRTASGEGATERRGECLCDWASGGTQVHVKYRDYFPNEWQHDSDVGAGESGQ